MAALVVRPVGEPPVELQMLKAAEALPIFEKALARRDMSLVSLGPLFKSSLFEVAILASDSESGSAAGACLWNMGSFSNPHIEQLIIPTTWYTFTSTKLVLLAGGLLLDLWAARGVWGFWSQGLTLSFCLALSAAVAVNAAVVWAVSWVRHLGEWVLGRKQKTRARLFAASAQGPRGPELLRAVVARAQNAAQERGYLMLICNLDEADPLRSCFGSGRFRTEFLQKALVDNLQVRDFAPDNFHDPRDI
ncbi:unnamed protein product [Polarella glacialis]|uniref:Uncharacterized protein n=1 Tax=Polarella glacialis TaxID=89957 RepID=A0A813FUX9_POLGL|nr:unnamed protein product [Polarella glacialis]